MKFHKNKFLTTVTAVALVLAVGACGSSSDDDDMMSTTTPTTPTTPTDTTTQAPETPEDALATAQAGYDALTGESTDAERTAAMTALVAALMLEGNEDAYVTYLEKKVADQEAAAAATAAAVAAEEASDMAKAVIMAIRNNTDPMVTADQPAAPAVKLAASSAGELTATQEGYMMSAAPEEIAGWRVARWRRTEIRPSSTPTSRMRCQQRSVEFIRKPVLAPKRLRAIRYLKMGVPQHFPPSSGRMSRDPTRPGK